MSLASLPGAGVQCLLPQCQEWVPKFAGGKLCQGHVMPLAMVCYGKRRRRVESARTEVKARRARGKDVSCYPCPLCSSWHLGTARSPDVDGCVRASAIVREIRAAGLGWLLGQLISDWDPKLVERDPGGVWRTKVGT